MLCTCSRVLGIFWYAMTAARPSWDMSTATSLELVRCLKKTWMMRPLSSCRSGLSLHTPEAIQRACRLHVLLPTRRGLQGLGYG